jgi:nucleoid DNA-binding protein
MNKKDLIDIVGAQTSTKKEAGDIVELIFNTIKDALQKQEKVVISEFGTFTLRERKERVGRNPKTGETVQIPAKKVVKFKASKEIF